MYARIVSDPAVLGGKPVVKGTRISVEFLLELLASGATRADVLKNYRISRPRTSSKPSGIRQTC